MKKFEKSLRQAPDATWVADVDEAATVRLTVVLKPAAPVVAEHHFHGAAMTHAEYAERHATAAGVVTQLIQFAHDHGLTAEKREPGSNQVVLTGTYRQALAAFRPDHIGVYEKDGKRFVARSGHLSVPENLASQIVAVMGFDQRPVAKPHFRRRQGAPVQQEAPVQREAPAQRGAPVKEGAPVEQAAGEAAAQAAPVSYAPADVAARYDFPAGGLNGAGQTIALIELGGGYDDAQVAAYFTATGIQRTGTLVSVGVDGAANTPGGDADGEVQLDIEVAGAVAPAANIAVYFGPNQGGGFQDAIAAAVADTTVAPGIISISWGGSESGFAPQDLDAIDQTLAKAVALGITVLVASGDNGASNGEASGEHVDFPSSSPHVLGCGGTFLPMTGEEVAWNDAGGGATGGGYSSHFPRPSWQTGNTNAQRGVPDVSGDASPNTGYEVNVDGLPQVIGGTSAVAPLWAGLIALVNQSTGQRAGFVNPALYANPGAFTDIVAGDNNGYSAQPGWDPVTGLGSPIGTKVLGAIMSDATPSTNPQA